MKVYKKYFENIPVDSVVTVGFFDGVHKGHKFLINELVEISKKYSIPSLIVTMWPHPKEILSNQKPKLLTTLDEKIELFSKTGVKGLVVLDFDNDMSKMSYQKFISDILINNIKAKSLIIGFNNSFGSKSQSSTVEDCGLNIFKAKKYMVDDVKPVNSTIIRKHLEVGEVEEANYLLGYSYKIKGIVEHGYKEGRRIGFPTANLSNIDNRKLIPANGVYIIEAKVDDKWCPAMLNIGVRPTFGSFTKTIEFHILDFNYDIYNKDVEIKFIKKIREEKKFDNVTDLVSRLTLDKEITKSFFNKI